MLILLWMSTSIVSNIQAGYSTVTFDMLSLMIELFLTLAKSSLTFQFSSQTSQSVEAANSKHFPYSLSVLQCCFSTFTISSTIRSPAPYSPPRNRDYGRRDPLPPTRSRDYGMRDRSPRDSRASYSLSQSRSVSIVEQQTDIIKPFCLHPHLFINYDTI